MKSKCRINAGGIKAQLTPTDCTFGPIKNQSWNGPSQAKPSQTEVYSKLQVAKANRKPVKSRPRPFRFISVFRARSSLSLSVERLLDV